MFQQCLYNCILVPIILKCCTAWFCRMHIYAMLIRSDSATDYGSLLSNTTTMVVIMSTGHESRIRNWAMIHFEPVHM